MSAAGGNLVLITGARRPVIVVTGPDASCWCTVACLAKSHRLACGASPSSSSDLVNTDWHPEHTGSNLPVATGAGRSLRTSSRSSISRSNDFVDWQNTTYKSLPAKALPTQTFYTRVR